MISRWQPQRAGSSSPSTPMGCPGCNRVSYGTDLGSLEALRGAGPLEGPGLPPEHHLVLAAVWER